MLRGSSGVVVLDPVVARCKCGKCSECVKIRIEKAFIFRGAVVAAVAWGKTDRLETIVSALIDFTLWRVSLARSGLGALWVTNEAKQAMKGATILSVRCCTT